MVFLKLGHLPQSEEGRAPRPKKKTHANNYDRPSLTLQSLFFCGGMFLVFFSRISFLFVRVILYFQGFRGSARERPLVFLVVLFFYPKSKGWRVRARSNRERLQIQPARDFKLQRFKSLRLQMPFSPLIFNTLQAIQDCHFSSGNDKRPGNQGFKKSAGIGHGSFTPLWLYRNTVKQVFSELSYPWREELLNWKSTVTDLSDLGYAMYLQQPKSFRNSWDNK